MKIAIVEDDINMRKSLELAFEDYERYQIKTFRNAPEALKRLDASYDLIVTDLTMPKMDGLSFIKELGGKYEVIVITGNATLNHAIASIRLGVKDFITKPFEIETLIKAIERSHNMRQKNAQLQPGLPEADAQGFTATSPALQKSLTLANRAAATDATVLLLGESGVGKELFANYIHAHSTRKSGPFVAINMASIPEHLVESELFGYEKGAFTDAQQAKAGLFETAQGGTLFLDEIGEMAYTLQAKLLRSLQERTIYRLGSSQSVTIDVRIVAATNANLTEKIREGDFREDLYYRIATIPLTIPPLRERQEEIMPIAVKMLDDTCRKYTLEPKTFNEEATEQMLAYPWPGNIRELLAVVERAAILSETQTITASDLFLESRMV